MQRGKREKATILMRKKWKIKAYNDDYFVHIYCTAKQGKYYIGIAEPMSCADKITHTHTYARTSI